MQLNLLRVNLVREKNLQKIKMHDNNNIMVILSSPSGVGKTTLYKNSTKIPNF